MKRHHLVRSCNVAKRVKTIVLSSDSETSTSESDLSSEEESYCQEYSDESSDESHEDVNYEDSTDGSQEDVDEEESGESQEDVDDEDSTDESQEDSDEEQSDLEDDVEISDCSVEIIHKRFSNRYSIVRSFDNCVDDLFHDDIIEFNQRANNHEVESLQDLCVMTVLSNLDFFSSLESPFRNIPGAILKVLKDHIKDSEDYANNLKIQRHLISKYATEIHLILYSWSCQPTMKKKSRSINRINRMIQKVKLECQNKLISLTVQLCKRNASSSLSINQSIMVTELKDVVRHQENLQELDISECHIDDDMLAIIGSTCAHLRCLKAAGNRKLTNYGLQYLFELPSPYGKCVKLEILHVDRTLVNQYGIAKAIEKLPNLEMLSVDEGLLPLAFMLLDPGQFVDKSIKLHTVTFSKLNSVDVEKIRYIFPHLTVVKDLTLAHDEDLTEFLELNNQAITSLDLQTNATSIEISNLVDHFGTNLTELVLICCNNSLIDISVIGIYCLKIQTLHIDKCNISETCEYENMITSCFSQLRIIQVSKCLNDLVYLPDSVITHILSRETLVGYYSCSIVVPVDIIKLLINKARIEKQVFSNLKCIMMKPSQLYNLWAVWLELICVSPKLHYLDYCNSIGTEIAGVSIARFIKRHKLGITLYNCGKLLVKNNNFKRLNMVALLKNDVLLIPEVCLGEAQLV